MKGIRANLMQMTNTVAFLCFFWQNEIGNIL